MEMEDPNRRDVALFRYGLIREAGDPGLSRAERGRLVRDLASRVHRGPDGTDTTVGRSTLDRWIVLWRTGGFDALVPRPRRASLRSDVELLALAVALKKERPARTATQVRELIVTDLAARGEVRSVPSLRTVQRHLRRHGLNVCGRAGPVKTFGRFEAANVNDMWTGDVLHGPKVGGHKALLFAFIDDRSRTLVGYRWGRRENVLRLEAALRRGLAARGIPGKIYVDNGSPFVSSQLSRACAVLGVRLIHSRPGQPQGRGKIERFFRTVRDQFLVEIDDDQLADLDEMNRLFVAWVEVVYHHRVHRETGDTPSDRFAAAGAVALPSPELLAEAFRWSQTRTVRKTATISLHTNTYQVDPMLAGRKVQVVFDPFDLSRLSVRCNGQDFGEAIPHVLSTWVHPQATTEAADQLDDMPPAPTGIDYLALIDAQHDRGTDTTINYFALTDHDDRDVDAAGEVGR